MKIKDLIKLTKHYPKDSKIVFGDSENFELSLKYDSEEGWIVVIKTIDNSENLKNLTNQK